MNYETKPLAPAHPFGCAGLYIHIPFCVRKCGYCDFLSAPADEKTKAAYMEILENDVENTLALMKKKGEALRSVYFGGGTPSVVEPAAICRIMKRIKESRLLENGAEVTIEVNPKTVSLQGLKAYHESGINRISMGIQSFHDQELHMLGRIHSAKEAEECYYMAREAGFQNVSLDLISSLPGQTLESFLDNLKTAAALNPDHISTYSLIIEEGTAFYDKYGPGYGDSEDQEKLDRAMYEMTGKILGEHGYERYEISNYARPGFESRHNSSYWMGIPYYGCGLGASGLEREAADDRIIWKRTRRQSELMAYLAGDYQRTEEECLSRESRMEEFMFLGLRMTRGVSLLAFEQRFGLSFREVFGEPASRLLKEGLLVKQEDRLCLSARGLDLANYCFSQFLL